MNWAVTAHAVADKLMFGWSVCSYLRALRWAGSRRLQTHRTDSSPDTRSAIAKRADGGNRKPSNPTTCGTCSPVSALDVFHHMQPNGRTAELLPDSRISPVLCSSAVRFVSLTPHSMHVKEVDASRRICRPLGLRKRRCVFVWIGFLNLLENHIHFHYSLDGYLSKLLFPKGFISQCRWSVLC